MKKIFFGSKDNNKRIPFWQPWGAPEYFGRFFAFLLLLLALLCVLGLFRSCEDCCSDCLGCDPSDPEWNQPIERGEEVGLPSPDDNLLPPFEQMEPIANPRDNGSTEIYPNLLYVIFNSDADDQAFRSFAQQFSARYPAPQHGIEYYNTSAKTAVLKVPENKRESICQQLNRVISNVNFKVVPVEVMTQTQTSTHNSTSVSDSDKMWHFEPIQAHEAWEITMGSEDIIVGIVDSYMDINHPDLRGDRCIFPHSVITGTADVSAPANTEASVAGHGTLVTSIAVGDTNNRKKSSGIAPNCKFIPVSMGSNLNTITQVEGILYCIYHGANVINISCGMLFSQEASRAPIEQQVRFSNTFGLAQEDMWNYVFRIAEERNVTIVWAAGNNDCYCAMDVSKRNDNTIRVSAVDKDLKKASFSNYGNFANLNIYDSTISAPGVKIWGALPNKKYDAWDGTSFAAPIITGVVALMKSVNKDLTTAQIIEIIKSSSVPVNGAPEIGNLIQINSALVKAKETIGAAANGTAQQQ
ncbi:MAG: S8 family serine peptidase [Alistipes sp.]|nr:S8 family serine peptidase [Alistipes sp.]